MNRTIKFRGVVKGNFADDFNGTVVYGSLVIRKYDLFEHWAIVSYVDGVNVEQPVDPESVAQLVGCDCDDREVYEGDILLDELEQEYTAEIYDRPEKIHALKLKEATS